MFRAVSLSTIRSLALYTQQQLQISIVSITCVTYTCCCVYRDTVRNMQSPIPKTNFEKLVLLVGFIIRKSDYSLGVCSRQGDYLSSFNLPLLHSLFSAYIIYSTQECINFLRLQDYAVYETHTFRKLRPSRKHSWTSLCIAFTRQRT